MGGQRLVGHVVKWQLCPVELDITRLEHQTLVVQRRVMWTRCPVIDGEQCAPYLGVYTDPSNVVSIVTPPAASNTSVKPR
jgi:hypothetical protein